MAKLMFLAGWFHYDWYLDHDDWREMFAQLVAGSDTDVLRGFIADLHILRKTASDDEDLHRRIMALHCHRPETGQTPDEWLVELADTMAEALAQRIQGDGWWS